LKNTARASEFRASPLLRPAVTRRRKAGSSRPRQHEEGSFDSSDLAQSEGKAGTIGHARSPGDLCRRSTQALLGNDAGCCR